jgi:hypothetical protein
MAYMTEKRLQQYTDQINSAPDTGGEWQAMATVLCLDDWEVRQRLNVLEAALKEILAAAADESQPAEYALGFIELRSRSALLQGGAHPTE